jgi:hypothetical protein
MQSFAVRGRAALGNFYTDTIVPDPRFNSLQPINDMALLEPVIRNLVRQIMVDAAAGGVKLMVFETYRSQARQTKLFAQGATQLKTVGVHHYGLACDLVKDIGGSASWKGDFSFLGKLAKKYDLIWGGDWGKPGVKTRFPDLVHVQRCAVADQKKLFAGTWYPDKDYDPYKPGARRPLSASSRERATGSGGPTAKRKKRRT